MAVTYMGKAMSCLKVSIHAPGRGNSLAAAGTKPISKKGRAMPRPSAANTASATMAGWVMAKPIAGPMNGAVQGVATRQASRPVIRAPRRPP